ASAANLADLVEPAKRPAPSASDMADQRTVTFAAPTPDVLSILGAAAQPVVPATRPETAATSGSFPAAGGSGSFPAAAPGSSYPAAASSGSYPGVTSSGSFPVAPVSPIHGAPTSDPFPAYNNAANPMETTWTGATTPATPTTSGSWPAASPDILDDPAPAPTSYGGPASSWPGFVEQPTASYPASYEVRSGWAVADDSGAPLTGPSPAAGTPTVPGRAVSAYDDVLSAPPAQPSSIAYETGDFTAGPVAPAWPEPPSGTANWPTYGGQSYGADTAPQGQAETGGGRRRAPEQDYNDYYR
ncbi:MAG: hypothetical protein HOY71_20525, partial [Nonomuraea sp.]|nr:hypothetical protein [Nonomuraea sp.]